MSQTPDEEKQDQDAQHASQPTGAAVEGSPTDDQDAGPASVPTEAAEDRDDSEDRGTAG